MTSPTSPLRCTASLLPALSDTAALRGNCVIVIDLLRASSTITAALAAHAREVVPVQTPDQALALKAARSNDPCLLGGERGGILIRGFDLGNSPRDYTPKGECRASRRQRARCRASVLLCPRPRAAPRRDPRQRGHASGRDDRDYPRA